MKRKILLVLLGILFIIQFFKPTKNVNTSDQQNSISKKYPMSAELNSILKMACYDCHSNNTSYPWYSEIQPVAWFLNDHVIDGKKHLNFDEFLSYEVKKQDHKLEEVIESQTESWMPISSYTFIHKDANLSKEQRQLIINWAKNVRLNIGYVKVEGADKD